MEGLEKRELVPQVLRNKNRKGIVVNTVISDFRKYLPGLQLEEIKGTHEQRIGYSRINPRQRKQLPSDSRPVS